jgi:hypothetical protein
MVINSTEEIPFPDLAKPKKVEASRKEGKFSHEVKLSFKLEHIHR